MLLGALSASEIQDSPMLNINIQKATLHIFTSTLFKISPAGKSNHVRRIPPEMFQNSFCTSSICGFTISPFCGSRKHFLKVPSDLVDHEQHPQCDATHHVPNSYLRGVLLTENLEWLWLFPVILARHARRQSLQRPRECVEGLLHPCCR